MLQPGGGKARLLLADDDTISTFMLKTILTKSGYMLDVSGNGREALQMLENQDYDLVLMDCMMPELDGYDTTAVIRDRNSNVRRHDIPVIALTANAFKEDQDNCLAAGMDDYISKPIDVKKLLEMVAKWVGREYNRAEGEM
jgi:CheY-like chemotaxis protein